MAWHSGSQTEMLSEHAKVQQLELLLVLQWVLPSVKQTVQHSEWRSVQTTGPQLETQLAMRLEPLLVRQLVTPMEQHLVRQTVTLKGLPLERTKDLPLGLRSTVVSTTRCMRRGELGWERGRRLGTLQRTTLCIAEGKSCERSGSTRTVTPCTSPRRLLRLWDTSRHRGECSLRTS